MSRDPVAGARSVLLPPVQAPYPPFPKIGSLMWPTVVLAPSAPCSLFTFYFWERPPRVQNQGCRGGGGTSSSSEGKYTLQKRKCERGLQAPQWKEGGHRAWELSSLPAALDSNTVA